jgi:hypothetical protein
MILIRFGNQLAVAVAVEFHQRMAVCDDILIRRAILAHWVDAQEQPELGGENLFDAALLYDLRLPLGRGERDTPTRGDFAVVILGTGRDGDELVGQEALLKKSQESAVNGLRRAGAVTRWRAGGMTSWPPRVAFAAEAC